MDWLPRRQRILPIAVLLLLLLSGLSISLPEQIGVRPKMGVVEQNQTHTHQSHHTSRSIIRSYKYPVPEYCRGSFETVNCFDRCQEHPSLTVVLGTIWRKEIHIAREEIATKALEIAKEENERASRVNGLDPQIGRALPCDNKCESDPVYWSCMADCDGNDHTLLWNEKCFSPNGPNQTIACSLSPVNLVDPQCLECLIIATRDRLNSSCPIAYLPGNQFKEQNLCHLLTDCDSPDPTAEGPITYKEVVKDCASLVKNNVDKMVICVNDKIMLEQWKCCHSDLMKRAISLTCEHVIDSDCPDTPCEQVLAPRLCQEKCKLFRNKSIESCIQDECGFFYDVTEKVCDRCVNTTPDGLQFQKDWDCVSKCKMGNFGCVDSCFKASKRPEYLLQNCYKRDYIYEFLEYLSDRGGNLSSVKVLPLNADSKSYEMFSWMVHFRTPFECNSNMCTDAESEPIDIDELKKLCDKNPFRKIDMLACSLVQPTPNMITLQYRDIFDDQEEFMKCTRNPTFNQLRTDLYKMMLQFDKLTVCDGEYCKDKSVPKRFRHPDAVRNMECQLFHCQMTGQSPYCEPSLNDYMADLEDYHLCHWSLDFSKWDSPTRLRSTYFDELRPTDIRRNLESFGVSQVLPKTEFESKVTYYTFPYFLIARSVCSGNIYGNQNFASALSGRAPVFETRYFPVTNRHKPTYPIMGVFKSALINLEKDSALDIDDDALPANPNSIIVPGPRGRPKEVGCHNHICYPAFAVPLMFHNIPKFEVTILDQGLVKSFSRQVYVSQFHSRVKYGRGELYEPYEDATLDKTPPNPVRPHAGKLFPKDRATFEADQELNSHQSCFADYFQRSKDPMAEKKFCPELEFTVDDDEDIYEFNRFAPIRPEDILRSQLTYGTAPTQAIAGFYDPRFLIIGDANMNGFEVADWSKLLKKLERDSGSNIISCVQQGVHHKGFTKPIYSLLDRTDNTYPIVYYRIRYAPKLYTTPKGTGDGLADTAIFEAIGLEDRLLLVTNRGLIPFYGHSTATVDADIAWTYNETEIVNKCFKIVRTLPSSQQNADLIVGITYEYNLKPERPPSSKEPRDDCDVVSQEIWVGRLTESAKPISWTHIKPSVHNESIIRDEISVEMGSAYGKLVTFKPDKEVGSPSDLQEVNPDSQITGVCFKAFRTVLTPKGGDKLEIEVSPGWCSALDATPVQTRENDIQVLVRMKTILKDDPKRTAIYFYIVATHTMEPDRATVRWIITSIIPRHPCTDEHREAVKNVFVFDKRYFAGRGCFWKYASRESNHIFIHGITYTRAYTRTVFLYGSRLLQSTDAGKSWMFIRGFPNKLRSGGDTLNVNASENVPPNNYPVHRIVRMAFDAGGHYAFLTNKLELWFGSVGSNKQIRLRPSPLESMVQLGLSKQRNIHDGIPFTIGFDGNNLYEMVAIVGKGGHVASIAKRAVQEWKMLKAQTIFKKFDTLADGNVQKFKQSINQSNGENITNDLQAPLSYDKTRWTTFCPYRSSVLRQNHSVDHSRTKAMFFIPPDHHIEKGITHTHASLLAFQAVTFSITWKTYFDVPPKDYAGTADDPFLSWVKDRTIAREAIMKEIKFTKRDALDHDTIFIQPHKYKPLILSQLHNSLLQYYYIDLNMCVELRMEFSMRHEQSVLSIEFEEDLINAIDINVENANGQIVQTETEKEIHLASVIFIIKISIKRDARDAIQLKQVPSGKDLILVPVTYHLIGAFGNCIKNPHEGTIGDKIVSTVAIGCPPNYDFVLDWNATLVSLQLKSDRVQRHDQPQEAHGLYSDCYDNEALCIWVQSRIILYFEIYDSTKRVNLKYPGKFLLRVIGGGPSKDEIQDYSAEEIEAFNYPGISDVSAIWEVLNSSPPTIERYNAEYLLTSGVSRLQWVCRMLAPCSRVVPKLWLLETVYWFRIQISNRDVDNSTLCLFEKEFDIMLYGFLPAPEFQLIFSIGFAIAFTLFINLVFVCTRSDRKAWMATKSKCKKMVFTIKNGFPKRLRFYEPPLPSEPEKIHRKKFITFDNVVDEDNTDTSVSSFGSSTSIEIGQTTDHSATDIDSQNSKEAIRKSMKRDNLGQFMYKHILARRLHKIVDRNRNRRINLIKKAVGINDNESYEHELEYEREFGKTVSQEELFTPPVPKNHGSFRAFL